MPGHNEIVIVKGAFMKIRLLFSAALTACTIIMGGMSSCNAALPVSDEKTHERTEENAEGRVLSKDGIRAHIANALRHIPLSNTEYQCSYDGNAIDVSFTLQAILDVVGDENEACRMIANPNFRFSNEALEEALLLSVRHQYYIFVRILLNLHTHKISAKVLGDAMEEALLRGDNRMLNLFADTPSAFNRIDFSVVFSMSKIASFPAKLIILKAMRRRACPSCIIL
jgi:hypothetical protein